MDKIAYVGKSNVRFPYWEVKIIQNWRPNQDFAPGNLVPVRMFRNKVDAIVFANQINRIVEQDNVED